MWYRVGRADDRTKGYSITNGSLVLIVPHSQGGDGAERAIAYLNSLR